MTAISRIQPEPDSCYEVLRGRVSGPPVFLMSGLFVGSSMWKWTAPALVSAGYSVIKMRKPFAVLEPSIPSLRSLVISILDELEVDSVVLCGNSLGGLLALDVAALLGTRVAAAVVSDSPGIGDTKRLLDYRPLVMTREKAHEIAAKLFHDQSRIPADMVDEAYGELNYRPYLLNVVKDLVAAKQYDTLNAIRETTCPVLLVWGRQDAVTPLLDWERVLPLFKAAVLVRVPDCGHCPALEQPEFFAQAILDFLSGLSIYSGDRARTEQEIWLVDQAPPAC